jgi:methionyl-tRNA formyltransferase
MIPTRLFRTARLGAFNMHGSLLPKFRGKAPVNWAVLLGETQTGATLHAMVARADAGDMVDQQAVPIGPRDTASQVMARVVEAARSVLDRQLTALLAGTAPRHRQDESQATCFGGRKPEDGRINWSWPARRIFNLVRAVTRPYPGAFGDLPDGRRLQVWWAETEPSEPLAAPGAMLSADPLRIAAGDGVLRITDFEWREGASPG